MKAMEIMKSGIRQEMESFLYLLTLLHRRLHFPGVFCLHGREGKKSVLITGTVSSESARTAEHTGSALCSAVQFLPCRRAGLFL